MATPPEVVRVDNGDGTARFTWTIEDVRACIEAIRRHAGMPPARSTHDFDEHEDRYVSRRVHRRREFIERAAMTRRHPIVGLTADLLIVDDPDR